MAVKVYTTGSDAEQTVVEVISEMVFDNLGIIAFVISTVVGMKYSA